MNFEFASFGQRLGARFIDILISGIVALLLIYNIPVLEALIDGSSFPYASRLANVAFFCFLYQPIFEATGGTIGKRIMGLRTINLMTGEAPSLSNSYSRSSLYFLFVIFLVIPAVVSGFAVLSSKKNQTWHDALTNIVVIKNK